MCVTISENSQNNILCLIIEDNGSGMKNVSPEILRAAYTTKLGKTKGEGVSLFHATADKAGGGVTVAPSELGGIALVAMLRRDLIDGNTYGNVSDTFESIACTHPSLDLECRLMIDGREEICRLREGGQPDAGNTQQVIAAAREFSRRVGAGLRDLGMGIIEKRKVG